MDTPADRHPGSQPTDRIFARPHPKVEDFHFGKETAAVFDDMLGRSVPLYDEIQRMVGELVGDFAADGTDIYDLGCSTCTTFIQIEKNVPQETKVRFVGVDSSPEMLEKAREKLAARDRSAISCSTARISIRACRFPTPPWC